MRNGLLAPLLVASSTLLALACGDSGSSGLLIDDVGGSGGSQAGSSAGGKPSGGAGGAAAGAGGATAGKGGAAGGAAGESSGASGADAGTGGGGESGGADAGGAGEAGTSGSSGQSGAAGDTGTAGGAAGASAGGVSGASAGGASGANAGGANAGGANAGGANAGGSSAGASAGGSSAGAGGSAGSGTAGGAGAGGSGQTGSECIPGTQLVYVFSSDNAIWSFDPPSKKFEKIATPDCSVSGNPNSMAIDRNLVAWINYIGGIYTFDLTTKKGCKKSQISLPSGFSQVGMGFSTNGPDTTEETLFLDGIGGGGLGKVDAAFTTVTKLGSFSNDPKLSGKSAELTGTGDGRLFGYFTTSPSVRVAELDKTNSNVLSNVELTGVSPPSSWAFTFWGGEFYLYAAPGNNSSGRSSVVRYDPVTKTVDKSYIADVGFTIVGAGVSTCAPTTKP